MLFINSPFRKNFILLSGKFYPLASLWYNKAAIMKGMALP
jgi:hypothetical protein